MLRGSFIRLISELTDEPGLSGICFKFLVFGGHLMPGGELSVLVVEELLELVACVLVHSDDLTVLKVGDFVIDFVVGFVTSLVTRTVGGE